MKRVLSIARHPVGGIRTYLKYMYGSLPRNRYSFVLLTVPNDEVAAIREDLRGRRVEMVEVRGRHFFTALGCGMLRVLWRDKIDLIHSHGTSAGVVASFINAFFRIPHIITFHETFDEQSVRGIFRKIKKAIIAFFLSRADCLNTVSEDARNNLLGYFPFRGKTLEKITVINNGIDSSYFSAEIGNQKDIYAVEGMDKDSFIIGFLGRFMPEKGFPVLIDAIDMIDKTGRPRKKVRVLALGWGAFIREYQSYIREKGLAEYFVFIEFQNDVRWVLRQIHVLVVPSLREAYGLVAAEGLASGTPVIASDCVGLREVLKDTPATMVEAGNAADLARAILYRMDDPGKNESLLFAEEAKKRFGVGGSAKKLELLFEGVGKRGSNSRPADS